MKFEDFKKLFFSKGINKVELLKNIKFINEDYKSLKDFINRFNKEIRLANTLLESTYLGNNPLPQNYSELHKGSIPIFTDSLQKELNWQLLAFTKNSDLINKFISLRENFEVSLLRANFTDARSILDEIENKICVSYWSIENRFILDEYEFDSVKNWGTRNIILEADNHPYVQYFSDFYSYKAESKVTFVDYNGQFNERLRNEGIDNNEQYFGLVEFIRFKGNYFIQAKYENYSDIIYRESNASIIDRYIIFIRVIQHLIVDDKESNAYIRELIHALDKDIYDINLKQALISIDKDYSLNSEPINLDVIKIIDFYTTGNYDESYVNSKEFLKEKTTNYIELYEIYVKSLIELKLDYQPITHNDSLANQISLYLYNVYSKNNDTDSSLFNLVKLSYVFNNSHIGLHLYSFVSEQLGWNQPINYTALALLNCKFINPRLLSNFYQKPSISENFIRLNNQNFTASPTARLFAQFYNLYISQNTIITYKDVPLLKNKVYAIRLLFMRGQYQECVNACKKTLDEYSLSIISKFEINNHLYQCYFLLGEFRNALILSVSTYLENQYLVGKMNLNDLLYEIIKSKFKNVGDKKELIELPIFFKINSNDRSKTKQTYELFLNANNVIKPSELINNCNLEKYKLIFFFKHVCVTDIMQLSKSFDSTYDINEERISICKFLTEFDDENADIYKSEISTLTQKNTISKVIGGIDERKIYVNESKIRQLLKQSEQQNVLQSEQVSPLTNESFQRYIQLLNFVKNNNEYKDINSIIEFGENGEVTFKEAEKDKVYESDDTNVILYLPAFRIFKTFFYHIREVFIFSKEFGLEAYLSTRIRHGTLPNHLRSVFETYFLVTSQTDGLYTDNSYWRDKLEIAEYDIKIILEELSTFSSAIDKFSETIKDNDIQCKIEKKNNDKNALFDYSYAEEDLIFLFLNEFSDVKNINEFIDKAFLELWSKTEKILEVIRNKFNVEYRDRFVTLIDNLHFKLSNTIDKQSISELLNNLMTCKTEIQNKLLNISKWFRRSESSFEGEYELEILAETSIQIIKNTNPGYSFEIEKNICADFAINAEYHQHFIDLMNNCMYNMIKHSHLSSENLNAKLSIKIQEDNLVINFENSVSNIEDNINKLSLIKQNWEIQDSNINKEGGTGFPKIKKIIHSDLNREKSSFTFYINDDKLNIILMFETKGLKLC